MSQHVVRFEPASDDNHREEAEDPPPSYEEVCGSGGRVTLSVPSRGNVEDENRRSRSPHAEQPRLRVTILTQTQPKGNCNFCKCFFNCLVIVIIVVVVLFLVFSGMSHQPVQEFVPEINRESPLPTYEEVCSTSRVEIGLKRADTRGTSRRHADNRWGILHSTSLERSNEPQAKQSKKCLIFTITVLVVFCYLFTVVGLLRSKNCSLRSTDQQNSVEIENRILAIHRSYEKKINYLNSYQKDVNRTYNREIISLLHTRAIADNEKQKLNNELEDLRKAIDIVIGQREQLFVQLTKAGLTPVYDIMTSSTNHSDYDSEKTTFHDNKFFQRYYNQLKKE